MATHTSILKPIEKLKHLFFKNSINVKARTQQAIDKAEVGDYKELEQLAEILSKPFEEQPEFEDYAKMPPDWGKRISVSCSS